MAHSISTRESLTNYLETKVPLQKIEKPEPRKQMPIIGTVVQWIRESEDRGTICKVLTYTLSFFIAIIMMATVVGIPLLILAHRELVAQNEEAAHSASVNTIYKKNQPIPQAILEAREEEAYRIGHVNGNGEATEKLEGARAHYEALGNEKIKEANEAIDNVKKAAQLQVNDLNNKLTAVNKELSGLQTQHTAAIKKIGELETAHSLLQKNAANPAELTKVKSDLEKALSAKSELENQIAKVKDEAAKAVADLQKEIGTLKGNITTKEGELLNLAKTHEGVLQNLQTQHQDAVKQLEEKIKAANGAPNAEVTKELETLRNTVAGQQTQLETFRNQAQTEILEARNQIQEEKAKLAPLLKANEELQLEIQQVRKDSGDQAVQVLQLNTQIEEMKKAFADQETEHKVAIEKLSKEGMDSSSKLAVAEAERKQLEAENALLRLKVEIADTVKNTFTAFKEKTVGNNAEAIDKMKDTIKTNLTRIDALKKEEENIPRMAVKKELSGLIVPEILEEPKIEVTT